MKRALKLVPVNHMDQVLELAMSAPPKKKPPRKKPAAKKAGAKKAAAGKKK